MTTSLSTGGGPVSNVQLSEGGFQVVYPLGLWSLFSGVVKVLYGCGQFIIYIYIDIYIYIYMRVIMLD